MNTSLKSKDFEEQYSGILAEYVTAIAWSGQGTVFAATSAAGEVVLWQDGNLTALQTEQGESVDCVAFSKDGEFLAVGGQDGKVKIWRDKELIATLENAPAWVDRLAWSPTSHLLAFSLGRYVQVWDADTREIKVTLKFDNSSVLGIDWRCDGNYLATSGARGVKVWDCQNWDNEPYVLEIPSASLVMAWSPDGKFLASGNMDRTIAVVESQLLISGSSPEPWIMRGFPGKIRQLAWSDVSTSGAPLLACSSVDGIAVWEKQADDSIGWEARILTNHVDIVQAIAFAPNSFLLASAGADGWICLWKDAKQLSEILTGAASEFSCLGWHPQGKRLAAGGKYGELLVWSKTSRGRGFGRG
ncbi:WD40 repeat domain-containing protein [Scytonema sp. NUACC26]|uniref:WD40 repeat domain-containing protein n=1 Tax=Scytonema sp. NUACC26 TaxID=3140176 RepID=UPI0034DC96C2